MSGKAWFRRKQVSYWWFRPKRGIYGAGLPINWKGWAFITASMALLVLCDFLLEDVRLLTRIVISVLFVVPFLWIVAIKTESGWRSRN